MKNKLNVIPQDVLIKAAIKQSHKNGTLSDEAAAIGIAGGEQALLDIMHTEGSLHIIDRFSLCMHYGLPYGDLT